MSDRPTKMVNGIKVIGVRDPGLDGCFTWIRGTCIRCVHADKKVCHCPYSGSEGFWLPEDQALPLLLTGDVK